MQLKERDKMAGLDERLNLIEEKISEKSFRENKGLGIGRILGSIL